jgi:hypothetical protein
MRLVCPATFCSHVAARRSHTARKAWLHQLRRSEIAATKSRCILAFDTNAATITSVARRREFLQGVRAQLVVQSDCSPRASHFWPLKWRMNRELHREVQSSAETQQLQFPTLPQAPKIAVVEASATDLPSLGARQRFVFSPLLAPAIFRKLIRDRSPFRSDPRAPMNQ